MHPAHALVVLLLLLATPAAAQHDFAAQDDFAARVLAVHNAERSAVGVPPLAWNDRLAADAAVWGRVLAQRQVLRHDDQRAQGENLWMGTSGRFTVEQMVGAWAAEKRDYRHGVFPDVAARGKVVGHYTQMVWRGTTQVGCALVPGKPADVLVCRYDPPGNWIGQMAY